MGQSLKIVIATTTLYGSLEETRAQLAIKTIREAKGHNYKIVVVDASNKKGIGKAFRNEGAIVFPQKEKTMGQGRRQALEEAGKIVSQQGYVVWTEPEKYNFISFLEKIVAQMKRNGADLAIPFRSEKSRASYPQFQRRAEDLNNLIFSWLLRKKVRREDLNNFTSLCLLKGESEIDHCVGVRIIGPKALPLFLRYKGEYGGKWASILFPVLTAIMDPEIRVMIGPRIDLMYPPEQRKEEEGELAEEMFEKRREQLRNTLDLVLSQVQA